MIVPFAKAHGCGNDFLIVTGVFDAPEKLARAICHRHTGVGADGLYLVRTSVEGADAEAHLYNSDGSSAEMSGNGTRCVAAWLVAGGSGSNPLRIRTGAGLRELHLIRREGNVFHFSMGLGKPTIKPGPGSALDIWIGNPQCVTLVENFDFDWKARGAEMERHPHFPNKTNVEFVKVLGRHEIEIRIWERGAGWTLSSGTGATASAVAAIHAGRADSPITVRTEGGTLEVRWEKDDLTLTGPAEITARGEFLWHSS